MDVPPADLREREAWLAAQTDALAEDIKRAMRAVIVAAWDAYVATLTAAGDLTPIDQIPGAWMQTSATVTDRISELHTKGAVAAWLSHPERTVPPDPDDLWWTVTNENAVSAVRDATNRMRNVGESLWQAARDRITTSIERGASNEALKTSLEELTAWSEFRADTVARTETVGAYVTGEAAGVDALGADGPVEKVWYAAIDSRTRDDHRKAHEQVVAIHADFRVGRFSMARPHASGAPAEQVVNCRCIVQYLYPGDTRPDGSVVGERVVPFEMAP